MASSIWRRMRRNPVFSVVICVLVAIVVVGGVAALVSPDFRQEVSSRTGGSLLGTATIDRDEVPQDHTINVGGTFVVRVLVPCQVQVADPTMLVVNSKVRYSIAAYALFGKKAGSTTYEVKNCDPATVDPKDPATKDGTYKVAVK